MNAFQTILFTSMCDSNLQDSDFLELSDFLVVATRLEPLTASLYSISQHATHSCFSAIF